MMTERPLGMYLIGFLGNGFNFPARQGILCPQKPTPSPEF
ncbi:hypothetical protein TNIN_480601, partial [Trichonephila inaurata madagascariensis]